MIHHQQQQQQQNRRLRIYSVGGTYMYFTDQIIALDSTVVVKAHNNIARNGLNNDDLKQIHTCATRLLT